MTKCWREPVNVLIDALLPSDAIVWNWSTDCYEQNQIECHSFQNEEIISAIRKLKKKKAPSLDGVQFLTESILQDLRAAFKQCIKEGKFTTIWKRANLIFTKIGEDKDPAIHKSYRPICLISNTEKLLEGLISGKLQEYRQARGLHPDQYGFWPERLAEDALHIIANEATQSEREHLTICGGRISFKS